MPTETENKALDTLSKFVYGQERITTRWGDRHIKGQSRGLRLEPSGETRLACAFGFILGLAAAGEGNAAEAHADAIVKELDALASYGGTIKHDGHDMPAYLVLARDDGSLHGLRLSWYRYAGSADKKPAALELRRAGNTTVLTEYALYGEEVPYTYAFNGGLLYHGAGDNSFACTLDSHLWSVHT